MRCLPILLLCAVLAATQSGCSTIGPYAVPPPPSEDMRSGIDSIGVASAAFDPEIKLNTPPKGAARGIGKGMAFGALVGFASAAYGFGVTGGLPAAILLPVIGAVVAVGVVAGGVYGAVKAEPAEKVEKEELAIKSALSGQKYQETLRERFVSAIKESTPYRVVPLEGYGPRTAGEKPSYSSLKNGGIDTVVETGVESLNVAGAFSMDVRIRLVKAETNEALYETTLIYRSASLPFSEWAENNASSLNKEIQKAYKDITERAVEEIFLVRPIR